MSPPLDFWILLFSVQYLDASRRFFNQGADIELIAVLVNKKSSFAGVNRLKKFKIAGWTLSCGLQKKNRTILYLSVKIQRASYRI
jgi:hypothetical protein